MNKKLIVLIMFCVMIAGCKRKIIQPERMCTRIDLDYITEMMPQSPEHISAKVSHLQELVQSMNEQLEGMSAQCRSYLNTVSVYEHTYMQFYTTLQIMSVLATLSPNAQLQLAANLALQELHEMQRRYFTHNSTLQQALSEYQQYGSDGYRAIKPVEKLLEHMQQMFKLKGLDLAPDDQQRLNLLEQSIAHLNGRFYSNIVQDKRHMVIPEQSLSGLDQSLVATFHRDDYGNCVVPSDESVYFTIMENCSHAQTRKDMYRMYGQVAYPLNRQILKEIIQSRHDYAKILGFDDFASFHIDQLMLKTVKKVEHFLWSMVKELKPYVKRDYQKMLRSLPAGIQLDHTGMLRPWDDAYLKSSYRKNFFGIHDDELANYFPTDRVVPAMLEQLQKVFHVNFQYQATTNLWAPDLMVYQVRSLKNQAVIGYLIFDLYQRTGKKIAGAMHMNLIPSIRDDCSIACAGASVVVAEFKPAAEGQPSVLEFSDVINLLHEVGHGLHSLLGATRFTVFSGTQVVQDFVETPSLMLEYWFDQPEMLSAISTHIDTGKPLSKKKIDQLIAAQKFGRAGRMLHQIYLALLSLHYFKDRNVDIDQLNEKLYKKLFDYVAYDPEFHIESRLAHLAMDYAAVYYTYPLSQVIAADLFRHLKSEGLWNYEAGMRYVQHILSHGGSIPPQVMIKRYLGRPFATHSYFATL